MNVDPNDQDALGANGTSKPAVCGDLITIPPNDYKRKEPEQCLKDFGLFNFHLPHNPVALPMWDVSGWEYLNFSQKYTPLHTPHIVYGKE